MYTTSAPRWRGDLDRIVRAARVDDDALVAKLQAVEALGDVRCVVLGDRDGSYDGIGYLLPAATG